MKRRFIALLLSFVVLVSTAAIPVYAETTEDFTVKVSETTATAGDSMVAVDILLQNNPGVAGFSFCVNYDTERLVLVDALICLDGGYRVITERADSSINLAWTAASGYREDGKIATLYFKVPKDTPSGDALVQITYREGYDSFYDGQEQDIAVQTVDGKVQISALEDRSAPSVNIGNATASPGDSGIVVPITIENNPGFSGFSFCVDYDSDKLILENAQIEMADGYKVVAYPEGTGVNLAWTDANMLGTDCTIAKLYFSVKDNIAPGKAFVSLTFREHYDSFYVFRDGNEQDVSVVPYAGYVDVSAMMAAKVTTGTDVKEYPSVREALEAAVDTSVVQLLKDIDEDVVTDKQITLDLNGCNVNGSVTAANMLICDSQTDDYTVDNGKGYGVITGMVTGVTACDGYIMLTGQGTSFHKVDVALDKLVLKPGEVALYYTGSFLYDEVVAENVDAYGIAMSTRNQMPLADGSDSSSLYTESNTSALLRNILSAWNTVAQNKANAKSPVYARAYLKLKDGTILYSDANATNLQAMVETVDAVAWDRLSNAQKAALTAMYQTYAAEMATWNIPNLKSA